MKQRLPLVLAFLALFSIAYPQVCPLGLSGSFAVGPTGNFLTLQAAFDSLHTKGLSGSVILELQPNYNSAVETFPIKARSIPCASATQEVTVRPKAGSAAITITSNDSTTTIDLDKTTHIIFDGRPGGIGALKNLVISNTHVKGSAIRFVNGASYNRLLDLDVHGVTTYPGRGVISIGDIDSVSGNSYNRIDSCNISGGLTDPAIGIAIASTYLPVNAGNAITGCNIFNFWNWPDPAYGISMSVGADSTSILGNSFYQSVNRDYPFSTYSRHYNVTAISINANGLGGPYNVSGNYIGGTAPHNGGSVMQLSGCQKFTGISVSNGTGKARASRVDGNVIANLALKDVNGLYNMINLPLFNGICSNNTVGCLGGFNTLNAETTENGSNFYVINVTTPPTDSSIIVNNHLSGIRVTSTYTSWTAGIILNMDYGNSYKCRVEGNVIGDTESGALNLVGQGQLDGININSQNDSYAKTPDTIVIRGNSISGTGSTGCRVSGINTSGNIIGSVRITANNIHRLNCGDAAFVSPSDVNVRGINIFLIDATPFNGTLSITDNKIYDLLANSSQYRMDAITGIYLSNNGSGNRHNLATTISRNLIKQAYLSGVPTDYDGDDVVGMIVDMNNDSVTVDNNVVQLGYYDGSTPPPCPYIGIQQRSGITRYLHNTVLLQGTIGFPDTRYPQIYGACFHRLDTTSCTLINNLFSITRTYSVDSSIRFGVLALTGNKGLSADYNLYYSGKNSVTALNSSGAVSNAYNYQLIDERGRADSLKIWQASSGLDQHSLSANPLLTDPDKDLQTPPRGVHLDYHSPADGAGTATATTLTDIDGELRASLTPIDIGADAGNYNGNPPPPPPPVDTLHHDTTATGPGTPPGNPRQDTTGFHPTDSVSIAIPAPNPFTTTLIVHIKAEAPGMATVGLYSFSGNPLYQVTVPVIKGDNPVSIPTGNYPDGTYVLKVEVDGKKQSSIVVKKT